MTAGDTPPARGMGQRFIRGTAFISLGSWLATAVAIVTTILLARILGPEIIGFYAFVFAIHEVLNALSGFALGLTLIQSQDQDRRLYDTAAFLSAAIALVALAVTAGVAWVVGRIYTELAGSFLFLLGFARIMNFCARIPMAHMERGLRYAAAASISFTSLVVPRLAAVWLALGGMGAWALLLRDLAAVFILLVLSLLASEYRFRPRWNAADARRLMSYARHIYFARNLEMALQRTDRILLGGVLGEATLGFYNQARQFSEMTLLAVGPMTRVSFNLFARFRDDPERLARACRIVNYFLVRAVLAVVVLLIAFPEELVRAILGERWLEAAPLVRLLAPLAGLQPLFANLRQLLNGRGRPEQTVRIRAMQVLLFIPAVAVAAALGSAEGVALALLCVTALAVLSALFLTRDLLAGSMAAVFAAPLLAAAAALLLSWSPPAAPLREALPDWLLPLVPVAIYGLLLLAMEGRRLRRELRYVWSIARGGGSSGGGAPTGGGGSPGGGAGSRYTKPRGAEPNRRGRAMLRYHQARLLHRLRPGPTAGEMDRDLAGRKLFFIVGQGRTGSKFLSSLLGQAADAHVAHEPCAADFHAAHLARLDPAFSFEYFQNYRKWFVYDAARRSGCSIYGEVNSRLRHHVDAIRVEIPQARLLRIFRDGRDVVRSMSARDLRTVHAFIDQAGESLAGDPFYSEFPAMDGFGLACWIWQRDTRQLAEKLPDSFRFERVLEDFDYLRTEVLDRLELELSREAWERESSRPRNITEEHHVPHWTEWDAEREETFWRICGELMERHGLTRG